MKFTDDPPFGENPNFYLYMRPAFAGWPAMMNISGDCAAGNSSGAGAMSVIGALGEYIERQHFYNEVRSCADKKITHPAWLHAIEQIKTTCALPAEHIFQTCELNNIFDNKVVTAPLAFISLGQHDTDDRNFIPFIDSCGQAAHVTANVALKSAFKEFVERQALVGAWLSERAVNEIDVRAATLAGIEQNVLEKLRRHGALYAFSLGEGLPGYSIIVFYFSKSTDDIVKYSVGMAHDFSPEAALSKALGELWQSYLYLYLNTTTPEKLDGRFKYLNELINFNHHRTFDLIPFFKEPPPKISFVSFINQPKFTFEASIQKLKAITKNIYLYSQSTYLFGKQFYVAKVISPDFYLHMGIQMPLNFDNPYAKRLRIQIQQPIAHAIPFP